MGYYTMHSLSILEGDDKVTDYFTEIGELSEYGDSLWEEPCKWYDSDDNMAEYSKRHPKTLFELSGEGEESPDLWKEYWLNGKCHRVVAEITFEPFDISKLK